MKKVLVKLVKYDMDKTKKRKRKDVFVDGQNESDVIAQLEKIHKGEKVVTIHEIIWDEEQLARLNKSYPTVGKVKFFDTEKGFGFITFNDNG